MKIGHERPPLSERLNAEPQNEEDQATELETMAALRVEAVEKLRVLITSMVINFEADCEVSSARARRTIEADMLDMTFATRKAMNELMGSIEADLNLMRRLSGWAPPMIAASMIGLIVMSFAVAWLWTEGMTSSVKSSALQAAGIATLQSPRGTLFVIDPTKLNASVCRIQDRQETCLTPVQATAP